MEIYSVILSNYCISQLIVISFRFQKSVTSNGTTSSYCIVSYFLDKMINFPSTSVKNTKKIYIIYFTKTYFTKTKRQYANVYIYLHRTVRSISAFSVLLIMMFLASQVYLALLSDASALKDNTFSDILPLVLKQNLITVKP